MCMYACEGGKTTKIVNRHESMEVWKAKTEEVF